MFNQTLLRIAQRWVDGATADDIGLEMGVEAGWVEKVRGTDGYLVIEEAVREGRAGWKPV